MAKRPLRAVIYLRVSLDPTGDGLAVERQREDCERIVSERGWTLVETYSDNSKSAFSKKVKRPDYDRMVDDYAAGRYDALVCWDLDRLTRQPRQLEDWIDAAEEHGLVLVTANGEADLSTDGGRMYARIKAAVARAEVERKGERQRRANAQRRASGQMPRGGVRPTGYDLETGAVIASEARVVKAVFDAFTAGASLKAIAAALSGAEQVERDPKDRTMIQQLPPNVTPLPTRTGRPWNPSSVSGLLRNGRYAGWVTLDGEIERDEAGRPVRGAWEPIVSDTVWLAAQERLDDKKRKTNHVGTHRRHLGSGLFLCGICERPVKAHNARYRCAGHLMRVREAIDELVLATVRHRLAHKDYATLLPSADDRKSRILAEAIERERGKITRAKADYKAEKIDGEFYSEIRDDAQAEIDRLEVERLSLAAGSAAAPVLTAADPVAAFKAADLATTRAVIDALCIVRLYPAPRGRKTFDPESISIKRRRASG